MKSKILTVALALAMVFMAVPFNLYADELPGHTYRPVYAGDIPFRRV